jgi:invasion protein IalB
MLCMFAPSLYFKLRDGHLTNLTKCRSLFSIMFVLALLPTGASHAQTTDERFQNWTYSCNQGACQIFVTLADAKNKDIKFSMSLVYNPNNKALSTIVQMPLGVALPPGLRIYTDKDNHIALPYQACDKTGCSAAAVLDAAMLDKMKAAENLQVQFIMYGKTTNDSFKIPMAGFTDAQAKLVADAK